MKFAEINAFMDALNKVSLDNLEPADGLKLLKIRKHVSKCWEELEELRVAKLKTFGVEVDQMTGQFNFESVTKQEDIDAVNTLLSELIQVEVEDSPYKFQSEETIYNLFKEFKLGVVEVAIDYLVEIPVMTKASVIEEVTE